MKSVFALFVCLWWMLQYVEGCTIWGAAETDASMESALLARTWVHAYEEDGSDGMQVFRPGDYRSFPPSRFRMRYTFYVDGTCDWFFLAPDDSHYMKPGIWRIEGDTLSILQDAQRIRFRIDALQPDLLRLEQLPIE